LKPYGFRLSLYFIFRLEIDILYTFYNINKKFNIKQRLQSLLELTKHLKTRLEDKHAAFVIW